ncbi:putative ABC transporter permease subunit [Undibacterium sp. Di26W]|uniref:putative ABC transporter permease subunit n=1 Tax=Undibacterium sp. Di26W TaxID=3413035 RepID=UPI003BF2ED0D
MARGLNFQPGTVAWLLWHEIRLAFYDMGESRPGRAAARGMSVFGICLIAFVAVLAHVGAWFLLRKMPPLGQDIPPQILIAAGLLMIVIFSMMLSLGLTRSVRALFERGDLDLLLSSPLSSRTIFGVRLAGVTFGVVVWFLVLLAPVANMGAVLGQWAWLGIYPSILGMAMITASLSMLLTLGLVKTIGVRHTRTVGQILGALTGASIFILSQLLGHVRKEVRQDVEAYLTPLFQPGGLLDAQSPLWTPARAMLGSLPAILVFSLIGLVSFWLTARFTHQFFVRGVQQSVGNQRKLLRAGAGSKAGQAGFGRSLRMTIIQKEWRLIARDPQLISQVLLQLLYITPLFLVIFQGKSILPGAAAGMVFLAASLAGSLIWVIVSAEDAPDLLRAAPVKPLTIVSSKLIAALLPVMLLMSPALVWLSAQQLLLGLGVTLCVVLAMLSSVLINLWQSKPAPRAQFNRRGHAQWIAALLEALSSFGWAGCVYVGMQFSYRLWVPLCAVLLAPLLAWFFRIERNL